MEVTERPILRRIGVVAALAAIAALTAVVTPGAALAEPEYNVRRNIPTSHGHWELQQLPTINPGGVVNASDWSYTFHPCTTVAIFGNGFAAPNTVIVRHNGNTWNIGAGSPWWWEGNGQINVTLPCNLQTGSYASISVKSNKTIEFIESLWPRFVFIS